jgi:quercetin dioxygenase-like cupin family protein
MTSFLTHLGPIGQFLTGLTAFLSIALPVLRWLYKAKKDLHEATSETMRQIIQEKWKEAIEQADPACYWTLDVLFGGDDPNTGIHMRIPMFPYKRLTVSENIQMAVVAHGKDGTVASLHCDGFGHIPIHCHPTTCETIEVRSGTITHIETGRVYRAGDIWFIPEGEMHSAIFQDTFAILTYRPPLKTAKDSPPEFAEIFKAP